MGDFGLKRQRVEFDVMSKRMMILRVSVWIEQLMCFVFKSATVFQWIRRNCRVRRRESVMGMRSQRALMKNLINQREKYFSPLDVEMIDQLLTLEVLCPRVQWIMRHRCGSAVKFPRLSLINSSSSGSASSFPHHLWAGPAPPFNAGWACSTFQCLTQPFVCCTSAAV